MNQASLSANGTPSNSYKVVILGSGAVGKTSLTIRYFNNTWSEEYNPTLQDIYRKPFELDNQKGHLGIFFDSKVWLCALMGNRNSGYSGHGAIHGAARAVDPSGKRLCFVVFDHRCGLIRRGQES